MWMWMCVCVFLHKQREKGNSKKKNKMLVEKIEKVEQKADGRKTENDSTSSTTEQNYASRRKKLPASLFLRFSLLLFLLSIRLNENDVYLSVSIAHTHYIKFSIVRFEHDSIDSFDWMPRL